MESLTAAVAAAIFSLLPLWKNDESQEKVREYARVITEETQAVQPEVDPFVVVAVIFRESSFRPKVKGKCGEVGLMQIMPKGAITRLIDPSITSEDLTGVRANIRMGVGHINYWRETCGEEDMGLWLSAYNSGRCRHTAYGRRVLRLYCRIKPGGCQSVS